VFIVAPSTAQGRKGAVTLRGIQVQDVNAHARLHVHVSTSSGKLQMRGTSFRSITLSGSLASVNSSLKSLSLHLSHAGSRALVSLFATDGANSDSANIFARG
jgi:hypothetical protein